MTPDRVAIVHDWLTQSGGAEVVLHELRELFPGALVVTALVDRDLFPETGAWDLRTTWLDRLPGAHAAHRAALPLYPLAWSSTTIRDKALVVSNKSAFCHGVRVEGGLHACYCLTPTRFVWEPDSYLEHEVLPPGSRLALRALLPWLRRWDRAAAQRVDAFASISTAVRDRVRRWYERDSEVIHPPVDTQAFAEAEPVRDEPYYLVVARLVPYRRIDVAIAAFNRLGRRLVIVGDGRDRARLEAMAGPTIALRGRLPQPEVNALVAGCEAFIWPGIEDFGIAPVEAMAAGRPVIARRGGGALDTVVDGVTGVLFNGSDADALAQAVLAADHLAFRRDALRAHARRFDRRVFRDRLLGFLERVRAREPQAARAPVGVV